MSKDAAGMKQTGGRLIVLEKELEAGRSLVGHPGMSARHFRLEKREEGWICRDLQSTNGTWIGGIRIEEQVLAFGDVITAAGLHFLFLENALLVPSSGKELVFSYGMQELKNQPFSFTWSIEPYTAAVEGCTLPAAAARQSGWMAAAPAITMLMTSLAGSGAMLFRSSGGLKLSPAALIGPALLMAGAFGLAGMVQRRLQKREDEKRSQAALDEYTAYLESIRCEVIARLEKAAKQWQSEQEKILALNDRLCGCMRLCNDWKLPAGVSSMPAVQFQLPQMGYQNAHSPAASALELLVQGHWHAPVWQGIQAGTLCPVRIRQENQLAWLAALYAWMVWNPSRRLVWIGMDCPQSIPLLPASLLDGKPLVFQSIRQWKEVHRRYPDLQWTICSLLRPESLEDNTTWIQVIFEKDESEEANALEMMEFPGMPDWRKVRQAFYASASLEKEVQKDWRQEELEGNTGVRPQADLLVHPGPQTVWDLEEDGPHILAAGSTGSGKSEGMLSVLLELAVKNSAQHVQMILVDFKGGAFARPFEAMPHLAGLVTNLSGGSMNRLVRALEAELERRQLLLESWTKSRPDCTADLKSYNTACGQNPISHLFVMIDEFAQLKARYPECMNQLQQTARIGRSLGLHLILATQKPAGVIDEQIWANMRSRICFRVSSASESREVLGGPEASTLQLPGEFVLQAGNRPLQKDRAYYHRQSALSSSAVHLFDETGQEIAPAVQSQTWLERLRSSVQARQEERRWILLPDPAIDPPAQPGIYSDEIDHLALCKESFFRCLLLAGMEEDVCHAAEQIAAQSSLPVYTFGLSLENQDWQAEESGLWILIRNRRPARIMLRLDDRLSADLLRALLDAEHLHLNALCCSPGKMLSQFGLAFSWRLAGRLPWREMRYALFENHACEEENAPAFHAWNGKEAKRIVFCAPNAKKKERFALPPVRLSIPLPQSQAALIPTGWIGMEWSSRKPVFWSGRRLILVCQEQREVQRMKNLARLLQRLDPMLEVSAFPQPAPVILACLEGMHPSDLSLLGHALQDCDLLAFGRASLRFPPSLGLRMPLSHQGDGLYFSKGEWTDLCIASMEEKRDVFENPNAASSVLAQPADRKTAGHAARNAGSFIQ